MDTVHNVAQPEPEKVRTTRPTLFVPVDLWRGIKQAALDAGMTAQDFVIQMFRDRVRPKKVRRA